MSNTTKARRAQGLEARASRQETVITRLKHRIITLEQQRGELLKGLEQCIEDGNMRMGLDMQLRVLVLRIRRDMA